MDLAIVTGRWRLGKTRGPFSRPGPRSVPAAPRTRTGSLGASGLPHVTLGQHCLSAASPAAAAASCEDVLFRGEGERAWKLPLSCKLFFVARGFKIITGHNHTRRIIESFWLEKTFQITESNCWPHTAKSTTKPGP